jgi:hypothetical protein
MDYQPNLPFYVVWGSIAGLLGTGIAMKLPNNTPNLQRFFNDPRVLPAQPYKEGHRDYPGQK